MSRLATSLRPVAPEEVDPAEAAAEVPAAVVAAARELAAAAFEAAPAVRDHQPAAVVAESETVDSRIERQLAAAIGRQFCRLREIALDPANQTLAIRAQDDRAAVNQAQAIQEVANPVGTNRALAYRVAEIGREAVIAQITEIGPANRATIDRGTVIGQGTVRATVIGPETVRAMEIDLVIGRAMVIVRATDPAMVTGRKMEIGQGTVQGMAIDQATDRATVTVQEIDQGAETVRDTGIDRDTATVPVAATTITGTGIGKVSTTVGTTAPGTATGVTAVRIGTPTPGALGASRRVQSD